jgi:MEDS: MEthanogen/methylotroph, DcmR Sensory domain
VEGLQLGDHVCALVEGLDEGFEVIAQAVAVGLAAGDRVMVFTESVSPVKVLARLEGRGIPAGREGQLEVLSAAEAYLPSGRFDPDRLLESLVGHVERATLDGYAGLRLVGDMAWALSHPAGVEKLAGYEAQVNRLYLDGRALGVCVYDRRAFDGGLLQQVTCARTPRSARPWSKTAGCRSCGSAGSATRTGCGWTVRRISAVARRWPRPSRRWWTSNLTRSRPSTSTWRACGSPTPRPPRCSPDSRCAHLPAYTYADAMAQWQESWTA